MGLHLDINEKRGFIRFSAPVKGGQAEAIVAAATAKYLGRDQTLKGAYLVAINRTVVSGMSVPQALELLKTPDRPKVRTTDLNPNLNPNLKLGMKPSPSPTLSPSPSPSFSPPHLLHPFTPLTPPLYTPPLYPTRTPQGPLVRAAGPHPQLERRGERRERGPHGPHRGQHE